MNEPLMPLIDEINAAINAPLPHMDPDAFAALQARVNDIGAGLERRASAGVRVHAAADNLDERRAQVLKDAAVMSAKHAQSLAATANSLRALLRRATLALCEQSLDLAQRDEAETARAQREADEAEANRRWYRPTGAGGRS